MKLCIIGNSHVGALRTAWTSGLSDDFPGITITCFAQRGQGIAEMVVAEGRLLPANPYMKRTVEFTSGGLSEVVVAEYDAFLLYGLHEHGQETGDTWYSSAVRAAALKDKVTGQGNHALLVKLRGLTDKPVWVAHDPLPALDPSGLVAADYDAELAEMQRLCYDPLQARLVPQPAETMVAGRATKLAFSKDSQPLAVGDDRDDRHHGADEIQHMNTAYGEIWLRAFLPGLAAQI
ncbi:conserved hypothetical protein [Citreicella sp. SE45]|nr:conserved hypothetical protein [Citreicella sp. SE45]